MRPRLHKILSACSALAISAGLLAGVGISSASATTDPWRSFGDVRSAYSAKHYKTPVITSVKMKVYKAKDGKWYVPGGAKAVHYANGKNLQYTALDSYKYNKRAPYSVGININGQQDWKGSPIAGGYYSLGSKKTLGKYVSSTRATIQMQRYPLPVSKVFVKKNGKYYADVSYSRYKGSKQQLVKALVRAYPYN